MNVRRCRLQSTMKSVDTPNAGFSETCHKQEYICAGTKRVCQNRYNYAHQSNIVHIAFAGEIVKQL